LLKNNGGATFGVFDPRRRDSPKKAWEKLVAPQRVATMNAPRFRPTDELGALLRALIKAKFVEMDVRPAQVE
jgi:hypothetical protein